MTLRKLELLGIGEIFCPASRQNLSPVLRSFPDTFLQAWEASLGSNAGGGYFLKLELVQKWAHWKFFHKLGFKFQNLL